jgi:hypothetical protein
MTKSRPSMIGLGLLSAVLCLSSEVLAQAPPPPTNVGQNAAVLTGGVTVTPKNSPAFVDASVYGTDICSAIHSVLTNWTGGTGGNSNGIVIDARGVSSLDCSSSSNKNPWSGVSTKSFINTVLLPAGTIKINQTWIPVSETRIIGEGPNLTIIQAVSGFASGADMIEMGGVAACSSNGTTYDCTGVVIEHLGIDGGVGSGLFLNGIQNSFSQELSYVNDVSFTNISGTGLLLGVTCSGNACSSGSNNSGPYVNLYYNGGGACANIVGKPPMAATDSLRGVHGLNCITSHSPAIYLDVSNTTMEDITIDGNTTFGGSSFPDGILVGSNSSAGARADLLRNIRGVGNLGNVIHISNNAPTGQPPNVSDITVLSASRGMGVPATVQDDLSGTTLSDASVGLYALGQPVTNATTTFGYSRFTTSPNLATWVTGTGPLGTNASCLSGETGSLYTCTKSSNCPSASSKTLWACVGGTWVGIK